MVRIIGNTAVLLSLLFLPWWSAALVLLAYGILFFAPIELVLWPVCYSLLFIPNTSGRVTILAVFGAIAVGLVVVKRRISQRVV